jgi:hypothetical protein
MALRSKPCPPRPELSECIRQSVAAVKAMSPRTKRRLLATQAKSWARQDRD